MYTSWRLTPKEQQDKAERHALVMHSGVGMSKYKWIAHRCLPLHLGEATLLYEYKRVNHEQYLVFRRIASVEVVVVEGAIVLPANPADPLQVRWKFKASNHTESHAIEFHIETPASQTITVKDMSQLIAEQITASQLGRKYWSANSKLVIKDGDGVTLNANKNLWNGAKRRRTVQLGYSWNPCVM